MLCWEVSEGNHIRPPALALSDDSECLVGLDHLDVHLIYGREVKATANAGNSRTG